MEAPECPVCLEGYSDVGGLVPRVLSCGHSACEACLLRLPRRFPDTVRCPACTQLVRCPPNPSTLPKNIDILRFSLPPHPRTTNPQVVDPKPAAAPQEGEDPHPHLVPSSWSHHLYSAWKDWILPSHAVSLLPTRNPPPDSHSLHATLSSSACSSSSISPFFQCRVIENQRVSLLRIAASTSTTTTTNNNHNSLFNYGYVVRVIDCLSKMREVERDDLDLILRACLRQPRICPCYGLWFNLEDSCLYLVVAGEEHCSSSSSSSSSGLLDRFRGDGFSASVFAILGMQICESLIGLQSQGLIAGSLGLSCFQFDGLGHPHLDLNVIAAYARKLSDCAALENASASKLVLVPGFGLLLSKMLQSHFFVSPEVLLESLHREGMDVELDELRHSIGDRSDAWSLGCLFLSLIVGDQFIEELATHLPFILCPAREECDTDYSGLLGKLTSLLEAKIGSKHAHLQQILCSCLHFKPKDRPPVSHVWKCMRGLIINPDDDDVFVSLEGEILEKRILCCLVLSQLFEQPKKSIKGLETQNLEPKDDSDVAKADLFRSLPAGNLKVMDMGGHRDCITGLAVSGGFLFSSSFDKTIHVWSLQDYTLVRSFIGHEQRVMAVVSVDEQQGLCISGDSGGGIFLWSINAPIGGELIKKWYEPKDWRYSGIHALIVSESQYLYTGSGDKLIKAWSLQDYTLSCTMSGHNSVVSSLAACEGILYSGSWDGTIRLWSLNDHSSLAVLEKETPGNMSSVLCLAADRHMLVVAHENGHLKIWKNDTVMRSIQVHNGAIFAVGLEGKWVFTGGWDKTVNVQELLGDDCQIDVIPIVSLASENVITALSYWHGNLFVGLADGLIKVHCYGE